MFLIAYRVTRVKGAFVDYMALLEFQDTLGQRQEKNLFCYIHTDF